jgi:hypothetical protein
MGWPHDYPLDLETLTSLGLPTGDGLPDEVFDLMALYPQPMRGQPSLKYIPIPYRQPAGRSERTSTDGR